MIVPKITNEQIPSELFYAFNGLKFHDDVHKYYHNDKNLISVTTLLHKFEEQFDSLYWSEVKGFEYDMPQLDVLEMWNAWNLKSTIKGRAIHNYAELLFNNKIYKFSNEIIDRELGSKYLRILQDYPELYKDKNIPKMEGYTIMEEYLKVKTFVDNFYRDTFNKLIPIKTELVVYDLDWEIAGMLDILFWNVKKQAIQIWDWKTNKEFEMKNDFKKKLLHPFIKHDACHFEIYSLQLSTYKAIIEKNVNVKIDGLFVVHLNEKNDNYKVIECKDYSDSMGRFLTMRKNEMNQGY